MANIGRMKALLLAVLLCAGCSFEMPHSDSARDQCERYVDELLVRGQECASAPIGAIVDAESAWRARCAKVIGVNPLAESAEGCIERVRALECEALTSSHELPWCHAFIEGT